MSSNRSAKITRELYDDEYEFCLKIGQLIDLSEARDSGPQMILFRLENGLWYVPDITDTIRFGLEGAGMNALDARKLAIKSVREGYLYDTLKVAKDILEAAFQGAPEDHPEEKDDEPGEPQTPTTEDATSSGQPTSSSEG